MKQNYGWKEEKLVGKFKHERWFNYVELIFSLTKIFHLLLSDPPRKTQIPRITRDESLPEVNRVFIASIEPNVTAGGGGKKIKIPHIHRVLYT